MKRNLFRYTVLAFLVLSLITPMLAWNRPVKAQDQPFSGKRLMMTTGHGEEEDYIVNITEWFTGLGGTVVVAKGNINSSTLATVDACLVGGLEDETQYFTTAEANALRDWFAAGSNKFLWIAGDSDYGSFNVPNNASMLLETVGSSIRMEPASIEDPDANCGASYRVTCNWTAFADPVVSDCVVGVYRVLYHGPTLLYGVDAGGNPVAIEDTPPANVHVIMQTGASGVIVDHTLSEAPMFAHTNGATGHFAMMAAQIGMGADGTNKLVASGAAPYGDYEPMWSDSYKDVPLTGSILVKNTIWWGLLGALPTAAPVDLMIPMIAGWAVAVVFIILFLIVLIRGRGK
jgi:hypothetical protein